MPIVNRMRIYFPSSFSPRYLNEQGTNKSRFFISLNRFRLFNQSRVNKSEIGQTRPRSRSFGIENRKFRETYTRKTRVIRAHSTDMQIFLLKPIRK